MEGQKSKRKSTTSSTSTTTSGSAAPVLPWMRDPIDITTFDQCPLKLLPFLDPRYPLSNLIYFFVFNFYKAQVTM